MEHNRPGGATGTPPGGQQHSMATEPGTPDATGQGSSTGQERYQAGFLGTQASTRPALTAEELERMKEMRLRGACLRCRLSKVKCSPEDPCGPCLSSAIKGNERKVLSFCYCVRTQIADVNIFQHRPYNPIALRAKTDALDAKLALSTLQPAFDMEGTTGHVMNLILAEQGGGSGQSSMVGMLTSQAFADAVQGTLDGQITDSFRRFLLAVTLAHTGWIDAEAHDKDRLSWKDLHIITYASGSELLGRLERALAPQALSASNKRTLQALFLVVFGTILGVGYSTQVTASPEFPADMLGHNLQQSPTLWVLMKEHLCVMLAHYLIFLGSMIGHKLNTAKERVVVENATRRWNLQENFLWAQMIVPDPQPREATTRAVTPFSDSQPAEHHNISPPIAVPCPDILQQDMPGSVSWPDPDADEEPVDEEGMRLHRKIHKRRTMLVVGSCNGQQRCFNRPAAA
ncbi:hypothetical protein NKR23_g6108 [Pleurostoma richardsiae]|uniref:Zn(2)-C6 fungal-type domain-containing protein n=1 Tax=Pleurostoma richardsiae TaxID=41990 RepID=A0AA38VSZ9_9PEZI|nr:hypothetical protein NKR23_g6108 [Pleurostoma richardsiae]